jgi:hypothetical protein
MASKARLACRRGAGDALFEPGHVVGVQRAAPAHPIGQLVLLVRPAPLGRDRLAGHSVEPRDLGAQFGPVGVGRVEHRYEHLGHQIRDGVRVVDATGEETGDRIDVPSVEGLEGHRVCGDLRLFATHRPCSLRRFTSLLGENRRKGYKLGPLWC